MRTMTIVPDAVPPGRRRPVNLSLSESLVADARAYTDNLSATVEELLAGYVSAHREAEEAERGRSAACADGWNAVLDHLGSYADEHSTL
jgi:antitoxin CcdA